MVKEVQQAVDRIGFWGTGKLLLAKLAKKQRYSVMLREVAGNSSIARLFPVSSGTFEERAANSQEIVACADRMLLDENCFFTFPYSIRGLDSPWQYDPLEKKYWPRRHYTEQELHAADTPKDVKIVWEINRFKDLPYLAQAAYLTKDARFAEEVSARIQSWIADNPFAASINWASGLELSIRLISWTTSAILLRQAGFTMVAEEVIGRSVYQHARYLAAELSVDKVVTTNHLIGEIAGLFIVSTLWDFPVHEQYAESCRRILEREIIRQTFKDGATREASSWYHRFVTDFFDLVDRVAEKSGRPMSAAYKQRLALMKGYVAALTFNGELVRYGDADDGWALHFQGDMDRWKDMVFGNSPTTSVANGGYVTVATQIAAHVSTGYLFLRAGEFGMGGDGFSSHAHDDFLSPILFLKGQAVLVDPGTFVYNGNPEERAKYRKANAHNGVIIAGKTRAVQRMNFGWDRVRDEANLNEVTLSNDSLSVVGKYGEWPELQRRVETDGTLATITDGFSVPLAESALWAFHLDPQWTVLHEEGSTCEFSAADGRVLKMTFDGAFDTRKIESYDYSPSYRVAVPGTCIVLTCLKPVGEFSVTLQIV